MTQIKNEDSFHIYDLIHSISEEYGGMTSAMLSRCKQFEEYKIGQSLTILTLASEVDVTKVKLHLQERWGITDRVAVRNIWHDLRHMNDEELKQLKGIQPNNEEPKSETISQERKLENNQAKSYLIVHRDELGRIIKREHVRDDSSLLLLYDSSIRGKRRLVLYNSQGEPVKLWVRVADFYFAWFDYVMNRRPAFLVNEHKGIGEFLFKLSIENIKVCQVIHGRHFRDFKNVPYGELFPSRLNTMKNLEQFDLVTTLTRWQKDDILELGVDGRNIEVLPNSVTHLHTIEERKLVTRNTIKGIVIARLDTNKRVEHCIYAIAELKYKYHIADITLDIVGKGKDLEKLKAFTQELNINDVIQFKGYVENAAKYLSDYSFLLFTSRAEGQGMVLIEAMAAGCIPISYDIRYGPSEVITHKQDGLLVKTQKPEELAKAIKYFVELSSQDRLKMRLNSLMRATYFSPKKNMERWEYVLKKTLQNKKIKQYKFINNLQAVCDILYFDDKVIKVAGKIIGTKIDFQQNLKIIITNREENTFIKKSLTIIKLSDILAEFNIQIEKKKVPNINKNNIVIYLQPGETSDWKNKVNLELDFV